MLAEKKEVEQVNRVGEQHMYPRVLLALHYNQKEVRTNGPVLERRMGPLGDINGLQKKHIESSKDKWTDRVEDMNCLRDKWIARETN